MTAAMAYIAVFIVIPIAITSLMFVGRKEFWRAITLFSVISIIAEVINFTLWILQIARTLPYATSGNVMLVDGIRAFASGLAEYLGATAWVLCILVAAQQRRIIWAFILTVMGVVSLAGIYVIDHPYSFFSPTGYAIGYEILIIILVHLTTILTLIFGLLIKPKQRSLYPEPAFYAPQPPPAEAG
ncbi:MAG TPA: hypothetical protein VFS83_19645 [Ktedonobacterales bacterium]|nr:hypothetical protein [Ktedonobacterales bacterium]